MIYLASPYSHDSEAVRHHRYRSVMRVTAGLLAQGHFIYSPILHCHELARHHELRTDFAFWQNYNFDMLAHADELFVLTLVGWQKSVGVQAEIAFAQERGIPVKFVNEDLEIR